MAQLFRLFLLLTALGSFSPLARAQSALEQATTKHFPDISRGSVRTIEPVLADLFAAQDPALTAFLEAWQAKELWFVKETEIIVTVTETDAGDFIAANAITGEPVGTFGKRDIKQIKPNSGVRGRLGQALVGARLASDDVATRQSALDAIARDGAADQLPLLIAAEAEETDPALQRAMAGLIVQLTISYGADDDARVAAIKSLSQDMSIQSRATLNPLLTTRQVIVDRDELAPNNTIEGQHVAAIRDDLALEEAYALIAKKHDLTPALTQDKIKSVLEANIVEGRVAGTPVIDLDTWNARAEAYDALVSQGLAEVATSPIQMQATVDQYVIADVYLEPSLPVITATLQTLDTINSRVWWARMFDLFLDGLSLASIFFLAAIGLAITFGVMRVINMAHGEFIMMGAYTGYVVQLMVPNYTVSLVIALPLAFCVTFAAGILLERTVIRHLYARPLETLLATFGVSIALQQIAKNIFGTQARPLTSPAWLDGAWQINEVVSIAWIRVAILVLSLIFFIGLVLILRRTRLGLETRAVTQNPRMAASMGINTSRINMMTFGLGSGIAGIAGVAIGLFAKVTSELGADFIVQSFMTVVVGGVGNVGGTLAGAGMIGFLQKGIEWMNPSNTLAAQTYMIIFIIIFIQFRPRGLIALKGRAAGD